MRWDLSYEQTKQTTLITNPIEYPHVVVASEEWQPLGRRRPSGSLVAPGTYTVKLTIGEQEFAKNLILKKDPHSARSEESIRAQLKLLLEIRSNINSVMDMIKQIELIRKQIYDLKALLKGDANTKPVITTGEEPDKKLLDVQDNFFYLRLAGGIQDTLRWPDKLYSKLMKLAGYIGQSDFLPTTQQLEVHEIFKEKLETYQSQFNELLDRYLPGFNNLLRRRISTT